MSRLIHAGSEPVGEHDLPPAMRHLPVTGVRLSAYPDLVAALACVKQAAALANRDLGRLDDRAAAAIVAACGEIRAGRWHERFDVDVLSAGAGSAANQNATEVIADRALELLGRAGGDLCYEVDLGQRSADVYPIAVGVALHRLTQQLHDALARLRQAVTATAEEQPVLARYRTMLADDQRRLADAGGRIPAVDAEAGPGYSARFHRHLAELTGVGPPAGPGGAAFVQLSGVLKAIAITLSTMCLRLAEPSGCPLIRDVVDQTTFAVIGHDVTVGIAAQAGRACQPVIAHSLFQSLTMLRVGCRLLADRGLRHTRVTPIPSPRPPSGDSRVGRGVSGIDQLSRRELQVATLVSEGHTNRWIASTLSLSTRTVETYVRRTFAKLSASSRSEVAAILVRSAKANRHPYRE